MFENRIVYLMFFPHHFRVLRFFHTSAEHYSVIFTSGCTAALKLVAESFDWMNSESGENNPGCFCYLHDNHTSVLGMRALASQHGAHIVCASVCDVESLVDQHTCVCAKRTGSPETARNCLFALPSQSNFSGRKYPAGWVDKVHNGLLDQYVKLSSKKLGLKSQLNSFDNDDKNVELQSGIWQRWFVVLDAAASVGTSPLYLDHCKPEFVTISFYKMFGYPTGIGALLVRNQSISVLKKTYFGGGTVRVSIASENFHRDRESISER